MQCDDNQYSQPRALSRSNIFSYFWITHKGANSSENEIMLNVSLKNDPILTIHLRFCEAWSCNSPLTWSLVHAHRSNVRGTHRVL